LRPGISIRGNPPPRAPDHRRQYAGNRRLHVAPSKLSAKSSMPYRSFFFQHGFCTRQPPRCFLSRGDTSAAVFDSIDKMPAPSCDSIPEAPAELERIINKALGKDRESAIKRGRNARRSQAAQARYSSGKLSVALAASTQAAITQNVAGSAGRCGRLLLITAALLRFSSGKPARVTALLRSPMMAFDGKPAHRWRRASSYPVAS